MNIITTIIVSISAGILFACVKIAYVWWQEAESKLRDAVDVIAALRLRLTELDENMEGAVELITCRGCQIDELREQLRGARQEIADLRIIHGVDTAYLNQH